jgi:hypothetical protein
MPVPFEVNFEQTSTLPWEEAGLISGDVPLWLIRSVPIPIVLGRLDGPTNGLHVVVRRSMS